MNNGYIDSHHETILLIMFEIFHNFVKNDIKNSRFKLQKSESLSK